MTERTKYILFCAQDANFQTRSMLVPYDLIMKCESRVKNLQVLRDHAKHDVKFNHNYVVDQLLIQNYIWSGNIGTQDETPFTQIVNELTNYADGLDEDCYCYLYDKEWYDKTICHVASRGFDHVRNYCEFRNKTSYKDKPIEIVEGFLVLESNTRQITPEDNHPI